MTFLKNLLVGIICIVIFVFGYYFLTQSDADFSLDSLTTNSDQLVARTSVFIERRSKLESLDLQTELFTDVRFTSLRSYSTAIPEQAIGRDNIFAAPQSVPTTRTAPLP